ncbi:MAG: hypothetical protein RLZ44_829 [Pseudomonadota bacterium]
MSGPAWLGRGTVVAPAGRTLVPQPGWPAVLAGVLLAVVAAQLAILVSGGVQIGSGNHAGLLPLVRRLLDPAYLPGDFGIDLRLHHHRVFAWVVATLARPLGVEGSLVALTHLGHVLLMLALLRLCRALGLSLAAYAVVAAALATTTGFVGRGYEINDFLGNGPIMPPLFAHAFVLLSLAAVVRRRPVAALAWAGAVLLLHVQIGIVWLAVLALAATLAREWPAPRELALGGAALAVIGAPALLDLWALLHDGVAQGGADALSYIAFRMPQHFVPRGLRHVLWPLLYTAVLGTWWWRWARSGGEGARNARLLFATAVALVALSALHALDYHVLGTGVVAQVQFVRLTPLIPVLGVIGLMALLQERLPRRPVPWMWLLAAAIVAPALAGDWRTSGAAPLRVVRAIEQPGDWYALCRWVRAHGPRDGLYATPPGQSGFTALTERSTLVEFKLNPDGGRQRDAWYQRLRDLAGEPLPNRGGYDATKAALNRAYAAGVATRLARLANRYGVRYAVLPADVEADGTELYRNASFRVIELRAPTDPP